MLPGMAPPNVADAVARNAILCGEFAGDFDGSATVADSCERLFVKNARAALASLYLVDACGRDAGSFAPLSCAQRPQATDALNVSIGQTGRVDLHASRAVDRPLPVLARTDPFQVFRSVVRRITVDVVDDRPSLRRRAMSGGGHHTVDLQGNDGVATLGGTPPASSRLQNTTQESNVSVAVDFQRHAPPVVHVLDYSTMRGA